MERDRGRLAPADHRDHLAEPRIPRRGEQRTEQQGADPLPDVIGGDIDRILAGRGIGRPITEPGGVGITDHRARALGDKKGPALRGALGHLGGHLLRAARHGIESRRAGEDVMGVDRRERCRVVRPRGPDPYRHPCLLPATAPARRCPKCPARTPA